MVSFQLGAGFATKLMQETGPYAATALRQGFSALFMFFFAKLWKFDFKGISFKALLLYGFSLALMNLCFYIAIDRIPLGVAVAIEFTGPLLVGLISSRKPIDFLWIILAAIGLYLLMPISNFSAHLDPFGVFMAFMAAIGWALYILSGHHLGKKFDGLSAVAIGISISCIFTIPAAIAIDGSLNIFTPKFLFWGLLLGLMSNAIPYSIEMMALKKLSRQSFSLLMSLEPAFAAIAGAILLMQKLDFVQIIAICFVMIASFGSAYFQRQEKTIEEIIL